MYKRDIKIYLDSYLFKGKIIILWGARQVGKTTLVKEVLSNYGLDGEYVNCELIQNQELLGSMDVEKIIGKLGPKKKIIVFDEAQTILNIGRVLKTLVDTYPNIQFIATGSSSFDLANKINEPLTGRSFEFTVFPLSISEISDGNKYFVQARELEKILRFGLFPDVYNNIDENLIKERLANIASNSLYKDILTFEDIKKPHILNNLLKLLAFQVGGEVSLKELSNTLEISKQTVEKYIDLLEKVFIIKKLYPLARNMRNEIRNYFKVYFIDTGIRNYIIDNLNSLENRPDIGAIWENFFIMERIKSISNNRKLASFYYWRTYDGKEIDLIEEADGILNCFECKWKDGKIKKTIRETFSENYSNSKFTLVNKDNYKDFLF